MACNNLATRSDNTSTNVQRERGFGVRRVLFVASTNAIKSHLSVPPLSAADACLRMARVLAVIRSHSCVMRSRSVVTIVTYSRGICTARFHRHTNMYIGEALAECTQSTKRNSQPKNTKGYL